MTNCVRDNDWVALVTSVADVTLTSKLNQCREVCVLVADCFSFLRLSLSHIKSL